MRIEAASPDDPAVHAMIERHYDYTREHTPHESGHAVRPDAMREGLRYWLAREGDEVLGSVALWRIAADHAEIKTMHVLPEARGRGVGVALLRQAEAAARDGGARRLSLETGRSEGFAASRALYARAGFVPCDAFGGYAEDPFSYCMTKEL